MNAPWRPRPQLDVAEEQLREQGYCILRGHVSPAVVQRLSRDLDSRFESADFCSGLFFGRRTKRVNALLKRSSAAARLALDEAVLHLVGKALLPHCDRFQLNLTQAIEIHPGERAQAPHRDQDMWQRPVAGIEYLVNVMWPLGDFTEQNGATRLWPGTQRDLSERRPPINAAVIAEMKAGDVLLHLGSTVHGAGANRSEGRRRGVVVGYSLGWLKPCENMSLTYPPAIARNFPPALADLVGYRRLAGNLGNYEGKCPSALLDGSFDEHAAPSEDLSDEQNKVLERFAAVQDWS